MEKRVLLTIYIDENGHIEGDMDGLFSYAAEITCKPELEGNLVASVQSILADAVGELLTVPLVQVPDDAIDQSKASCFALMDELAKNYRTDMGLSMNAVDIIRMMKK